MKMPEEYFERDNKEGAYERILFLPRVLQTQELNELQGILQGQMKSLGQSLYKNGEILSGSWDFDGKILKTKGLVLSIEGLCYKIKDASFSIPEKIQFLLCKIEKTIISPKEDQSLLDPFDGENYKKEGALRLKAEAKLFSSNDLALGVPIFIIQKHKIFAFQQRQTPIYDKIIDLGREDIDLKGLKEGLRIHIESGKFILKEPIEIEGNHIKLDFSHRARLVIEDPSIPYFFKIKGTVFITGVSLALEGKALSQKSTKLAHIEASSKLYLDDSNLEQATKSFEGSGSLKIKSCWEL